ncbi:hypothetical protein R84B8_00814 [Treponema sp. R8-4-B8]
MKLIMSENLKFGDEQIFLSLKKAMNDDEKIKTTYSSIIGKLITSEFWSTTNKEAPRVKWFDGRAVSNDEDGSRIFRCSGIYLWGAGSCPRYIGKAERQSFRRRFNRYIFSRNSQCELARRYEKEIKYKGIDGFPNEIIEWYEEKFSGTARLQGAVDFAKHGIDNIWFTLFPTEEINYIDIIERILINVANDWNIENNYDQLINVQHI